MTIESSLVIRSAVVTDVPILFELIQALAEYEKLADAVIGSAQLLEAHLFGHRPYAEAVLSEVSGKAAGFALFFPSYSTFLTQPGIYLEDLFVLVEYRGQGIGKALIAHVAQVAVSRRCGRMEWSVLAWNQPAIDFYHRMGATILDDWQTCRIDAVSLTDLARTAV